MAALGALMNILINTSVHAKAAAASGSIHRFILAIWWTVDAEMWMVFKMKYAIKDELKGTRGLRSVGAC